MQFAPARVHNNISSDESSLCLPVGPKLKGGEGQAWACVRVYSPPAGAVCPSPPDLACFVYDEEERAFSYWGRNSALHLTKAIQRTRKQRRT